MEQAAETTTQVVNRTSGKKIPAKKAAPKKRQASAPKAKGKTDVAAEAKPKKAKKAPAGPAPARGLGKSGMRRPDAWCAVLDNLEIGKTYARAYLEEQMVKQYGSGSRANHIWWAQIYSACMESLGIFAKQEDGTYLYAGVTTFNPKEVQ